MAINALALAALLAGSFDPAVASHGSDAVLDGQHSHIGFVIQTRWGTELAGYFPDARGQVETLSDGQHRVRLYLPVATVQIVDSPTYTRMTRGAGFFDAARYPTIEFVSDPYPPQLLSRGGGLSGQLRIRDVQRQETFQIQPAQCDQPGYGCDVLGTGNVRRDIYGMSRWSLALHNRVRFVLRIRMRAQAEQ